MSASCLDNVTIVGGGVLGGQIAWHSAFKGKTVTVYDAFEAGIKNCQRAHQTYAHIYAVQLGARASEIESAKSRLTFTTDLTEAVHNADLVIEAIPENPDIKVSFYEALDKLLPKSTILATNSSTLLPSTFSSHTGRPDKFCCLHFANLIWSGNIAEVMAHPKTSQTTLTRVTQFAIEIGMVPIPLEKESSGYVCNALLVPIMHAAQTLVTNGISTPEYVDRTYMIINRGCGAGPFGIMDIVGMKTCYDICHYWGEVKKDQQMLANAAYIKEHFLDKGLQGLQGGKGYYEYPNPTYQSPDFLKVPDISEAEAIARVVKALP